MQERLNYVIFLLWISSGGHLEVFQLSFSLESRRLSAHSLDFVDFFYSAWPKL
jgi:hypothetical protein